MLQHYLATATTTARTPRPFPSFPRVFPSALLARIPIARRTGCSSGIMRPEEFSQAWAGWGDRRGSINRVSCSRFSSVGRERDDGGLRRRIIRYNSTARWASGVRRGKKQEAMSIDVMKPVSRKAPYRERHGTNLFTPQRLWNCNPQAARPSSRRSPWKCFQMRLLFVVDERNARLRRWKVLILLHQAPTLYSSRLIGCSS